MSIYIVEMLRWGDRECHSYVIGAFSTAEKAREAGLAEEVWRAGKYTHHITVCALDFIDPEVLEFYQKSA